MAVYSERSGRAPGHLSCFWVFDLTVWAKALIRWDEEEKGRELLFIRRKRGNDVVLATGYAKRERRRWIEAYGFVDVYRSLHDLSVVWIGT